MLNIRNHWKSLGLGAGIFVAVLAALILISLFGSVFTIGPGQRGVLMTWGAVQPGVLQPGLHFKVPFMQSVVKMSVRIKKSQAPETAASKDLQDVETTTAVNWNLQPQDAEWIYEHVGTEKSLVQRVIDPAISNAVKAVTAHYNAENLIVERDAVRAAIEAQIRSALKPYRVVVDSVNITNFSFSPQYSQAIEQKQVAQQKALQATYELQKARVDAQQVVVRAQAQSQAQALLQKTITPEVIQLKAIRKWDGKLPKVVGGTGVFPIIGNISGATVSHG
ncbi:prohibitin family protein [Acidithiobacillus sp. MC6.1]|nr:prohibitin family protein [Acidithiobacillus sp. MC6.1]